MGRGQRDSEGAGQKCPPCQSSRFCTPGASPSPWQSWMGPLPAAAVDSWVGCTLNEGIQPQGQIRAQIQLRFFLQSHTLCGLGSGGPVCLEHTAWPEPQPTPNHHSPAS